MEAATIKRILDKRRMKKKTKTYRLAIRVIHNRESRPFPLDLEVTLDDFKKLPSSRLGPVLAVIKAGWLEAEEKAKDIVKRLGIFTFPGFQKAFYKAYPSRSRQNRQRGRESIIG